MRELEWPAAEVAEKRSPTYEWAFMKAALEDKPNERAYNTFEFMYGHKPTVGAPYWLVRMAIYYGALEIGYKRKGMIFPGIEKQMLACVRRLDVNALRNNPVLWHHTLLHDAEDAASGGRELVTDIAR